MSWAQRLAATRYPHPAAAVTLVKCLRVGVDLGFRGDRTCTQAGPNLKSAAEHAAAINDNIKKEIELGRCQGPYDTPPFLISIQTLLVLCLKSTKLNHVLFIT